MSNSAERAVRRYYLSTRKDRSGEAAALREALKDQGWELTFDWAGRVEAGRDGYSDTAVAEMRGVEEADVLIGLLPGGLGTHVEIGAAIALGKPVILHALTEETLETPYPCVFHYHPQVDLIIGDLDPEALLARILVKFH